MAKGAPESAIVPVFGTIADSGAPFAIGGRSGGLLFSGLIDEVEVFNRALTPAEIEKIYVADSAGKCRTCSAPPSGMLGWWPGDGNAKDIQSGNNGQLKNGTSFATGEVGKSFSFD